MTLDTRPSTASNRATPWIQRGLVLLTAALLVTQAAGAAVATGPTAPTDAAKAVAAADDAPVAASHAADGNGTAITIGQTKPGNIFVGSETPSFDIRTEPAADRFRWTIRDYWGETVASGTKRLIDGEAPLTVSLDERGYYELTVVAMRDGERVGSEMNTVGLLSKYDFRAVEDSMFGMQSHFNRKELMPLVRKSGTKSIRDSNGWSSVEREKGVYTFEDRYVEIRKAAARNDIDSLLIMAYGNDLYYNFTGGDSHTLPPTDEAQRAYAEYGVAMLNQYGSGRLSGVEIWNEPNWAFGNSDLDRSPETYYDILETTYPILEEEHPDVPVVGGVTARTRDPFQWTERVLEQGGADVMDGVSFHPYRHSQRPEVAGPRGGGSTEDEINRMQNLTAKYNDGEEMPVWITEIGHTTGIPGRSTGDLSQRKQSQYITRTYTMAKAAGLEKLYYYKFRDGLHNDKGTGILHDEDHPYGNRTPKPTYVTYSTLTRQLTNFEFAGKDGLEGEAHSYRFEGTDGPGTTGTSVTRRVMWTTRDSETVTLQTDDAVTVRTAVGEKRTYEPRNGEIYLTLSEYPLYVTGEVSAVRSSSPITLTASDAARGEPIPLTVDSRGPRGNLAVGDTTVSIGTGPTEGEIDGSAHVGPRVVVGELQNRGKNFGRLHAEVNVTSALSGTAIPQVAAVADGRMDLDVRLSNQARSRSFRATGLSWDSGDHSGSRSLDRTVDAGTATTVSTGLGALGERALYRSGPPLSATVTFENREPLTAETNVSLNPVWRRSVDVDGTLDGDAGPSIGLDRHGTVSMPDYGGSEDLSGSVDLAWDAENLYLTAEIRDDTHFQDRTGGTTWRGDSIQFGVTGHGTDTFAEINVALTEEGPQVFRTTQPTKAKRGPLTAATAAIERDDDAGTTTYEVAIPWESIAVSPEDGAFRTAWIVNDNDGSGRKGYIWWGSDIGSSKSVESFPTAQLVEEDGSDLATPTPTMTPTPTETVTPMTMTTPTTEPTPTDSPPTTAPADDTANPDGPAAGTAGEGGTTPTPASSPGLGALVTALALLAFVGVHRRRS